MDLHPITQPTASLPLFSRFPAYISSDPDPSTPTGSFWCNGFWNTAILVVSSVSFLVYLAVHAKKNLRKLCDGGSYVIISYYGLVWMVTLLNLAWCLLQAWECSPGKEVAWNLLSLLTVSAMLFLEISLIAFLLKDDYTSGMEALPRIFLLSALVIGADMLLKIICVFGFSIPLFRDDGGNAHIMKSSLWIVEKLLLTAAYGFILFVHFSKWREKLPPRPTFYKYIVVMFVYSGIALFASGLASGGTAFGNWFASLTVICYHSLYLPLAFTTFLVVFFQEEEFLLDNAYYAEMKDAGFFDADWE